MEENGRKKNIRRNMISGVLQKAVALLLPFAVRTVFIYTLDEAFLGLNSLFTSILHVLNLAELGVGSAIVFSMYEPMAHGDKQKLSALLRLYKKIYRIIGCAVLVLGIAIVPLLPVIVRETLPDGINLYVLYGINLANTVISYFFLAYRESLLNASQRVDIVNTALILVNAFVSVVQILLLIFVRNYYCYCIVPIAGTLIRNIIVYRASKRAFPDIEPAGDISAEEKDGIKKRVAGLFCFNLCTVTRNSFDSIILTAFMGLTIVARYNNYFLIFSVVTGFLQLITSSCTASVGNSIILENQEKNHSDFEQLLLLYLWVSGACTACMLLMYQPFMRIWAGESKMFTDLEMIVFCVYFFVSTLGTVCATYRSAAGIWWEDRFRPIVEALMNPLLNILLVRSLGTIGVILSTILCLVFIGNIWGSSVLFKNYFTGYSQTAYLLKLLFYTVVTTVACGICYFIVTLLGINNLFLRIPFAVLIPNAIYFAVYRKLPEYKGLMERVKSMLPARLQKAL